MIVQISDDFSPDKIIRSGQCFRARLCPDGSYLFPVRNRVLIIHETAPGSYEVNADPTEWEKVWMPYFDLARSYRAVRERIPEDDPFMRLAADEGAGIRILCQDPWETLITFIISQRKSIPAIRQCVQMLCKKWGDPLETAYGTVYGFPTAESLCRASERELTDCKVGYRLCYIQDAAARVGSGALDLESLRERSYEEVMTSLMKVRGVGVKVANCVALFAYGQTAAAPVDTWIMKIINRIYDGRDPFQKYGPGAGILQQYAFFYAQNHKGEF